MTEEFNLWGITHEPGETYQPCNGSEGTAFIDHFCSKCGKDLQEDCDVLTATMILPSGDPNYPTEWVYNENGNPTCTAFDDVEDEPF